MEMILHILGKVLDYSIDLIVFGVGAKYLLPRILGRYFERKMREEPAEMERWKSIWNHYAQGHPARDVVACKDVRCSAFTA